MSRFFIDRPIFAIVIALLAMLGGGLSILGCRSSSIRRSRRRRSRSRDLSGRLRADGRNTVVQVIEQQMNGLNNLLYLASTSDDSGTAVTTLTFAPGTNPDIAQVQVQNKCSSPHLCCPRTVQQAGIRVTQSSSSYLLVAGFVSSDNSMSRYDIANYVVSHLQDPLSRVNGVGNFNVFGTQYSMRIWLDTDKLNSFALTPVDVSNAILARTSRSPAASSAGRRRRRRSA
jgi:multidrug efflux pump